MYSTCAMFSKGDAVTILPYNKISAKFIRPKTLPSGCCFQEEMKKYCEKNYVVERVIRMPDKDVGFYKLSGISWSFTDEMLMIELPENANDDVMSFDEIMNFCK